MPAANKIPHDQRRELNVSMLGAVVNFPVIVRYASWPEVRRIHDCGRFGRGGKTAQRLHPRTIVTIIIGQNNSFEGSGVSRSSLPFLQGVRAQLC